MTEKKTPRAATKPAQTQKNSCHLPPASKSINPQSDVASPHSAPQKPQNPFMPTPVAILLVNLGSPEAPTKKALRPYLQEFLTDRRVIDLPRWQWLPILHGIVLNTRPKRSAHAYRQIW